MYKKNYFALGVPSDDNSSDIETNSKGIVSRL